MKREPSAPSIKSIRRAFPRLTLEQAHDIRTAIKSYAHYSKILGRIDDILGTCGVEYIPRGHNAKSPAIAYCNTGDSYGTTILYVGGRFRIGCWGDIVERGNYD